ncbi:DUF3080 family protein [Saccharospirillum impatiens]|uniref:DUF3080 family protein n=1 Tax=Saccharospirillum impatiens TaxID=169438 RepID=UPI00146CE653|nr:DUF3080 family protein [Saccharospirillum impatiens]
MACTQSGDDLLADYVKRVSRVLDADIPAVMPIDLPAYPATRALRQAPPEVHIDVLDAWALRGCEVFTLMGERNSILGRVADPLIRLDYERRLLTLLPQCLASEPDLDNELVTELDAILDLKVDVFPQHLFNATLANPDYQRYWTGGSGGFAAGDEVDFEGYRAAQQALAGYTAQPLPVTQSQWLQSMKLITEYPMGGRSLTAMRWAIEALEQSEQMLRAAAEDARLCPMGRPLQELGFARNVMGNIFAREVQPWLVGVDQRFLAGYDALSAMTGTLGIGNSAIQAFEHELNAYHNRYRTQIRQQVEAWQALFDACGEQATGS